jgi:hypothetical protein
LDSSPVGLAGVLTHRHNARSASASLMSDSDEYGTDRQPANVAPIA